MQRREILPPEESDRDSDGSMDESKEPQKKCFSFHQRGYCMRGDLCKYKHGSKKITMDNSVLAELFQNNLNPGRMVSRECTPPYDTISSPDTKLDLTTPPPWMKQCFGYYVEEVPRTPYNTPIMRVPFNTPCSEYADSPPSRGQHHNTSYATPWAVPGEPKFNYSAGKLSKFYSSNPKPVEMMELDTDEVDVEEVLKKQEEIHQRKTDLIKQRIDQQTEILDKIRKKTDTNEDCAMFWKLYEDNDKAMKMDKTELKVIERNISKLRSQLQPKED